MTYEQAQILMDFATERDDYVEPVKTPIDYPLPGAFTADGFGTYPRNEEELKKLLGHKYLYNLKLIGSFFKEYQPLTSGEYLEDKEKLPSVLNIPCTGRNLAAIFGGSKATISRVILLLQRVGGLKVVDADHSWRGPASHHFCRTYAVNKEVERLVLGLCEAHGVKLLEKRSRVMRPVVEGSWTPETEEKVRVSSKLWIDGLGDDDCRAILWKKYGPLIAPRLGRMEAANARLPREQQTAFDWKIGRSEKGLITSVGIRATCGMANLKKSVTAERPETTRPTTYVKPAKAPSWWIRRDYRHRHYQGLTREEYLDRQFGAGNWEEFDVHGSVYQVAHLLNFGEWVGNEVDPYEIMFGRGFQSETERAAFKGLCFPLYFDRQSTIVNNNRRKVRGCLATYGKEETQKALDAAIESMTAFTGPSVDSEIFLSESLIYADVVHRLRMRLGVDGVVQVYDAFFHRKDDGLDAGEISRIVKEVAEDYQKEWALWKVGMGSEVEVRNGTGRRRKRGGRRSEG